MDPTEQVHVAFTAIVRRIHSVRCLMRSQLRSTNGTIVTTTRITTTTDIDTKIMMTASCVGTSTKKTIHIEDTATKVATTTNKIT